MCSLSIVSLGCVSADARFVQFACGIILLVTCGMWRVQISHETICPRKRCAQNSMIKNKNNDDYDHHLPPSHSSFILYYPMAKYSTVLDNKGAVWWLTAANVLSLFLQVKRQHYISEWLKVFLQCSFGINTNIVKRDLNSGPAVFPFSIIRQRGCFEATEYAFLWAQRFGGPSTHTGTRVRLWSADLKMKAVTLTNTEQSLWIQNLQDSI